MLGGGFEHLSHSMQCHGYHQIVECVIMEYFVIQYRALAALHDDGQTRLIDRRHAHRRRAATDQREGRQRRLMAAIERRQSGNPRRQVLVPLGQPGDLANSLQTAVKHGCFSIPRRWVHGNGSLPGAILRIPLFAGLGKNPAVMF